MKIQADVDTSGTLLRLLHDARSEADGLRARLETYEKTLLSTRLIMGHELKRPATAIRGYLDLALEQFGPDVSGGAVDAIKKAQDECALLDELNRLFLQILKLDGKRAAGCGETVEIEKCVAEALDQLPDRLDAKRRVSVRVAPDAREFRSSGDALRTVMANIVENALLYSDSEAPVELRIERAPDKRGSGAADLLKIRVKDRGRGIPEEFIKRVFKPFVRLHEDIAEGYGLGLTLVRSLVELHGGSVFIRSEEGKGTAVWVTIPETPESDGGGVLS